MPPIHCHGAIGSKNSYTNRDSPCRNEFPQGAEKLNSFADGNASLENDGDGLGSVVEREPRMNGGPFGSRSARPSR